MVWLLNIMFRALIVIMYLLYPILCECASHAGDGRAGNETSNRRLDNFTSAIFFARFSAVPIAAVFRVDEATKKCLKCRDNGMCAHVAGNLKKLIYYSYPVV